MLTHFDRIVVAARERPPVVRALHGLLGAQVVSERQLPIWAAERTTLRAGVGEIEVLSPKGVGAVADFIGRRGPGIFALGVGTDDVQSARSHLQTQAASFEEEDEQLFVTSGKGADLPGLHLLITPARARAPVGLVQRFCGATLLHRFAQPENVRRVLGAHPSRITRVETTTHGFTGSVIHFGHGFLSHLSILAPSRMNGPVARCFYQRGPGIYEISAVTEQLAVIRTRLAAASPAGSAPSADAPLLLTSDLFGGVRLRLLPQNPSSSIPDIPSTLLATARACD